jgi:prepilin-type processing-associated H-X9-DG protein
VLAAAALAAPRAALADDQKMALSKAFPMLEQYLGVPPGERSRFYLVYRATRNKRPTSDARAAIVGAGGAAVPLGFDHAGIVTHLPTLAELKGPAQFVVEGAPFKLGVELRCAVAPSTHVAAGELAAALAQVNAAVAKLAGALAMMVPKVTTAFFPDSGGGHALFADGHQAALPVYASPIIGSVAFFEPAKAAGAKAVVFAKAPSRILLGAHPKGV